MSYRTLWEINCTVVRRGANRGLSLEDMHTGPSAEVLLYLGPSPKVNKPALGLCLLPVNLADPLAPAQENSQGVRPSCLPRSGQSSVSAYSRPGVWDMASSHYTFQCLSTCYFRPISAAPASTTGPRPQIPVRPQHQLDPEALGRVA